MHIHISKLIEILHQSIHASFQSSTQPSNIDSTPLSSHATASPATPDVKNVIQRQLSESQKSHHYSIINHIYQHISTATNEQVLRVSMSYWKLLSVFNF